MSKEILDAIGVVAYEKGIDPEILFTALEDALLAAYRKTNHASRSRASSSTARRATSASSRSR